MATLLTGSGHEELNVFWSVFGLSAAHTVPFLVVPLYDGGYSALHEQFYKPGGFEVKKDPVGLVLGLLMLE